MQILTFYERQKIEFYLRLKLGVREIARKIGRDHSVISREIQRNKDPRKKYYEATPAEEKARRYARATNKRKLDKDWFLEKYVANQLKVGWSPEQIAGRLREHPPRELRGKTVSHESIYQYIYQSPYGKYLYHYLRKKNSPRRQKRCFRKPQKFAITERVSIHLRPSEVQEKTRFGDWEADTVVFRKYHSALSVQYERKSMLVRMQRLASQSKESSEVALTKTIESLPQYLFKTFTFDNGGEWANHINICKSFNVETYFCDPYSAWQKGGVENVNGLIRQYLPRKIDLNALTDQEIHAIQEELNDRPRKSLDYLTPNEVIALHCSSGALNS